MQIVSIGDNLHEMSNPVSWEKYFKMSSADKTGIQINIFLFLQGAFHVYHNIFCGEKITVFFFFFEKATFWSL